MESLIEPNIHPLLVHFAIALTMTAALAYVLVWTPAAARVHLSSPCVRSIPVNSDGCADGAHTICSGAEACAVAVIVQLKSGSWRVQVRREGQYASKTFLRKSDADDWAVQAARDIDNGKKPSKRVRRDTQTFGHLHTTCLILQKNDDNSIA